MEKNPAVARMGVQHAHQKGILHRDLKPSNVLVCLYDGVPVPKVIDFGIAKATGQQLTERTMFTQFGSLVGTLEYMSPEQAEMSQLGIDTRSDVYSLGVLLYELLTGTTPLERPGRDGGCPPPLPQIRTCPIEAYGSSSYGLAAHGGTQWAGHGSRNRFSRPLRRSHANWPRRL